MRPEEPHQGCSTLPRSRWPDPISRIRSSDAPTHAGWVLFVARGHLSAPRPAAGLNKRVLRCATCACCPTCSHAELVRGCKLSGRQARLLSPAIKRCGCAAGWCCAKPKFRGRSQPCSPRCWPAAAAPGPSPPARRSGTVSATGLQKRPYRLPTPPLPPSRRRRSAAALRGPSAALLCCACPQTCTTALRCSCARLAAVRLFKPLPPALAPPAARAPTHPPCCSHAGGATGAKEGFRQLGRMGSRQQRQRLDRRCDAPAVLAPGAWQAGASTVPVMAVPGAVTAAPLPLSTPGPHPDEPDYCQWGGPITSCTDGKLLTL